MSSGRLILERVKKNCLERESRNFFNFFYYQNSYSTILCNIEVNLWQRRISEEFFCFFFKLRVIKNRFLFKDVQREVHCIFFFAISSGKPVLRGHLFDKEKWVF